MLDVVVDVLALAGSLLVLVAGIGVVRFPDVYSRMHSATKASTLGVGLIAIAGAIGTGSGTPKFALAGILIFITAPSAAHLVARAARRSEGSTRRDGVDDLAELLDDLDAPDDLGAPGGPDDLAEPGGPADAV